MTPWFARQWAALRMLGRSITGTDPNNPAEWVGLATEATTRELMALAQLRLRDFVTPADVDAAADPQGRLMALLWGRDASAVAQALRTDSNRSLVSTKPGAIVPPGRLWLAEVPSPAGGVLYTNGTGGTVCIEQIILANNSGANLTQLSIGVAAGNTRIFVSSVGASATTVLEGPIYVANGETVRGTAAVAGETCSGYGYKVT